jgi:membrane protein DedA with SNARE-associated domain
VLWGAVLEALLARWGYLAVGIGTLLEGEAVLLAAGALAHRGLLDLPLVMVAAFVGSVIGDQIWFHVGERFGRAYLDRRPALRKRADALEPWVRRFGDGFVFGFRFLYGLRTIAPLLLGASRYPALRFTVINLLGAVVWAVAFGAFGWGLGAGLEQALARRAHLAEIAAAAVAVALGLVLVRRAIARRAPRG